MTRQAKLGLDFLGWRTGSCRFVQDKLQLALHGNGERGEGGLAVVRAREEDPSFLGVGSSLSGAFFWGTLTL